MKNCDFIQNVKNNMVCIITEMFDRFNNCQQIKSLKYFIGGSHRFNYATDRSDIDIFVNIQEEGYTESITDNFIHFLYGNGFMEVNNSDPAHGEYIFADKLFSHTQFKIHILLIEKQEYFERLRNEHKTIADILKDNSIIIDFILELKKNLRLPNDKMGKYIYRSLVGLTNG